MKCKAKDIAKELGVSPSSVSLVLNGKKGVGEKLRKEIINKIDEMNCEHLLKTDLNEKGNIGFIVYKSNATIIDQFPFFNLLLENINKTVHQNKYQMNILYLTKQMSIEEQKQMIESSGCKGYIVYAVEMYNEDLEVFQSFNRPCVFLDNSFSISNVDAVSIDNFLGVHQALEYLYNKGHRNIGYIKSKINISSFDERFEAFQKCLEIYGLKFKNDFVIKVGYLENETEIDVITSLHKIKDIPTAYLADNDLLAYRAIKGMKQMGYKVPEEISVIGFDNRPCCSFSEPNLTTIGIARDDMGNTAIKLLISKIEDNEQGCLKILISTSLIERDSVSERKIKEV